MPVTVSKVGNTPFPAHSWFWRCLQCILGYHCSFPLCCFVLRLRQNTHTYVKGEQLHLTTVNQMWQGFQGSWPTLYFWCFKCIFKSLSYIAVLLLSGDARPKDANSQCQTVFSSWQSLKSASLCNEAHDLWNGRKLKENLLMSLFLRPTWCCFIEVLVWSVKSRFLRV